MKMGFFKKTPTRDARLYDSENPEALRRRVAELEEVVEKYRTKRVGPYTVKIEIKAGTWPEIFHHLEWMAKSARNHGPDGLPLSGADSNGAGYSVAVESNTVGGPGEPEEDKVAAFATEQGCVK